MPTDRPRTLDTMYGTGITPDEAPHVERTVDGEDYSVDVDLTPAATTLLEALAAAIGDGPDALAYELGVLMFYRSHDDDARDHAVQELLTNRAVRRALTIRLTPETAEELASNLDEAALEPSRCDQYDHGDKCRWYAAAEGDPICPRHLPADPQP